MAGVLPEHSPGHPPDPAPRGAPRISGTIITAAISDYVHRCR